MSKTFTFEVGEVLCASKTLKRMNKHRDYQNGEIESLRVGFVAHKINFSVATDSGYF